MARHRAIASQDRKPLSRMNRCCHRNIPRGPPTVVAVDEAICRPFRESRSGPPYPSRAVLWQRSSTISFQPHSLITRPTAPDWRYRTRERRWQHAAGKDDGMDLSTVGRMPQRRGGQIRPEAVRTRSILASWSADRTLIKELSEIVAHPPADRWDQERERREKAVPKHPHGHAGLGGLEQLFELVLPVAVGADSVTVMIRWCCPPCEQPLCAGDSNGVIAI